MRKKEQVEWEKSPNELYADKWFEDHGFTIVHKKRKRSATIVYLVEKNDVRDTFSLPEVVSDMEDYMNFYKQAFSMMEFLYGGRHR